jgi:predicted nucleic acid-binding Zn ribbon protein
VTPDDWFTQLLDRLPGDPLPTVSDDERDALLDLARVAAHTSERWTAPISTFLAGMAYAASSPAERAQRLRALVDDLDR